MSVQDLHIGRPGWIAHADRRHRFALTYPPDWEVAPGLSGLLVSLVAPEATTPFRPNMNVVRRVLDKTLDLNGMAEGVLASLMRLVSDPLVIDIDTAVVADQPARRLLVGYR